MKIENGKMKMEKSVTLAKPFILKKPVILNEVKNLLLLGVSLFALASCSQLQDSLSSEQLVDQKEGIGTLSAESTTFYYNGTESDDISGSEAHLVLNLSQLADATNAAVKYNLAYKMDDVDYTTAAKGNGTLGESKSKYYVDLSPAINLIDGEQNPAYGDISYTITVSGLVNASGNDYNGRSIPTFSKLIKFAPLYPDEVDDVSTANASEGLSFEIPLNGKISDVDEDVTFSSSDENISATFKASISDDGKAIVVKTTNDLLKKDFTGTFDFSGIKPVGGKETYSHTFTVSFTPAITELVSKEELTIENAEGTYQSAISYDAIKDYLQVIVTLANITSWGEGSWNTPALGASSSETNGASTKWKDSGAFTDKNVVSGTGGYEVTISPSDYPNGIFISGKKGLAGTLYVTGIKAD